MPFDKVFFDFDSTLVHEETLDLLAKRKGVGEAVSRLTAMSMEGAVPVGEVFRQKMLLLAPTSGELREFSRSTTRLFTRDAPALVDALHWLGKEVYVISSGFHEIIDAAAVHLSISPERVFANRIAFDSAGRYVDTIDEEVPLLADGKAQAVRRIPGAKTSGVMVGDAVTDMAAKDDVALFVGFGGVARRQRVEEEAPVYISCRSLGALLPIVASPEEFQSLLLAPLFHPFAHRAKRLQGYVRRNL